MNYNNVTINYKGHTVVEDKKELKNEFKRVSKEEFEKYVDEYPNELIFNVSRIYDPSLGNHNDFTNDKKWPESMVTKVVFMSEYGREDEYYIKESI